VANRLTRVERSIRNWSCRILKSRTSSLERSIWVSAVAAVLGTVQADPSSSRQVRAPRDGRVLSVGAKVADWQLAHLDSFDYIPIAHRRETEAGHDWIQAAFYIGLAQK
jgi:hypothetical protein